MKVHRGLERFINDELPAVTRSFAARDSGVIRYLVIGLQRSGTTLVGDLLDQHPDVEWLGERFWAGVVFPYRFMVGLTSSGEYSCSGLKLFSYLLKARGPGAAARLLSKLRRDGWKFLAVERSDRLAQAISLARAVRNQRWTSKRGTADESFVGRPREVVVDLAELEKAFQFLDMATAFQASLLERVPAMRLVYERDLEAEAKHQKAASAMFSYLGLPDCAVKARLTKQAGGALAERVANWEEVQAIYARYGRGAR